MSIISVIQTYNTSVGITLAAVQGKVSRVTNTHATDAITITLTGGSPYSLGAGKTVEFWYDNSSWKNNTVTVNSPTNPADVLVTDQTSFDAIFTGTIAANTSIFIKRKATPYLLNNEVTLSSGVRIISDGAVVNRNSATARFKTVYKNTLGITSGSIGNAYFTMDSNPTTYFSAGDIVSFNGIQVYEVLSVDATKVNLTSNIITTAATGSDILYSYQTGIFIDGWTFDGQGGVNGLSGSYTYSGTGGAFSIPYTAHSNFTLNVINSKSSSDGGAYNGFGFTFNNVISNISNCYSSTGGGGIYGCKYSIISKISYCYASNLGGGCSGCTYSIISEISNCSTAGYGGGVCDSSYSEINNINYCSSTASNGGGVYNCVFSKISNVNYCTASVNGGGCVICNYSVISDVNYCTAGTYGGGCYDCDYCTISNINYCTASSYGGGCSDCDYCNISNINYCGATTGGGACYNCSYSDISSIKNCTAGGAYAGGCQNCNYCFFHGAMTGCTTNGGSYATIANCLYSLALVIRGTAASTAVTTAATINAN